VEEESLRGIMCGAVVSKIEGRQVIGAAAPVQSKVDKMVRRTGGQRAALRGRYLQDAPQASQTM
jgi:hypothetical protein